MAVKVPEQPGVTIPTTELQGVSIAILGMGKSGLAAARLLMEAGAWVTLADEHAISEPSALRAVTSDRRPDRLRVLTGSRCRDALDGVQLLVVSPGVPVQHELVNAARAKQIPVIGEIELASWFLSVPIVAVTGTNGKSTTVRLIGAILEADGRRAFVGGNLGTPLSEAAVSMLRDSSEGGPAQNPYEVIVAEVSSFQLETTHTFHPHVAILLNLTPDHLDRHPSFEAYQAAKHKIFLNQTSADAAIVNVDDPSVTALPHALPAQRLELSLLRSVVRGVYLADRTVMARLTEAKAIMDVNEVRLRGRHNLSNVLAAVAAGLWLGCSVEAIRRGIQHFSGTEHVLEPVGVVRGVQYVNDSKGTNVDAVLRAIDAFEEPIVLILGGKDKGGDFARLREAVRRRVQYVLVMGEAAGRIAHALDGVASIEEVATLADAVHRASVLARAGDVVLLSPGCASFDMFRDYQDRGQHFKRLVQAMV